MMFMTIMNLYNDIMVNKNIGHPFAKVRYVASTLMLFFFFLVFNINQVELKAYFRIDKEISPVIKSSKINDFSINDQNEHIISP